MNRGVLYAAGAYTIWGLLPLFWKALVNVPELETLANRVVWALLVAFGLNFIRRESWTRLMVAIRDRRTILIFILTAALLSFNWGLYIWAVNDNHVVETSLGYFINPLLNVFLGVAFLRERLRPGQAVAISVALAGVLFLTITYGAPPWIALGLAASFGLYGLLRKTAPLASLEGFTLESMLMFPPALAFLIYTAFTSGGVLFHGDLGINLLLISSGLITAAPLLLFAAGARMVTMTTLGLLQYIAPTMQFSLGVLVYGEALTPQRLIGFIIVWIALVIYSVEGALQQRRALHATNLFVEGDRLG